MIASLLQETNVSSNVNFVFYSDTEIREFSKLVGLMLNADPQDLSLSQLNYQTVKNSILAMADFEEASVNITETLVEENICAENEKFSIKEKISGLINMRVKPWLLESESCNR
ncbi:MAG: hypothetical protein PHE33_02000 [Bacteroidales bacterium]|nr:hypothetical protein [Bacteroidales bacterium]